VHRRRIAAAAVLIMAGSLSSPLVAHADTSATTFHVDAIPSKCSDSTTDSVTTPYCTIQAAVDAATTPGDTVVVASGIYAPFTVTSSGTATAPITIVGAGNYSSSVENDNTTTPTPILTFAGASYIDVESLQLLQTTNAASTVTFTGSSNITVGGSWVSIYKPDTNVPMVDLDAGTSSVTFSRDKMDSSSTVAAVDLQGSSDDVLTTDDFFTTSGPVVTLDQTKGVDVTSNDFDEACGADVDVRDGSTQTSIENNIMKNVLESAAECTASDAAALRVDAASAPETTADYNIVFPAASSTATTDVPPYSWAGTDYSSATAFAAATGQGAHDLNTDDPAAAIDSANSDAPGELTTDAQNNPRVDDTTVPDTGAGRYTYYDRGWLETQDPLSATTAGNWPTSMPVGGLGTFTVNATNGWTTPIASCTYDFWDGSPTVTVAAEAGQCTTKHAFSTAGSESPGVTVTAADGASSSFAWSPITVNGTNVKLDLSINLQQVDPRTVSVTSNASADPWNVLSCEIDFGDGTKTAPPLDQGCGGSHTYSVVGNMPVNVTVTDSDGNTLTASGTFTAAGYFTPLSPTRVLDTRKAIGVTTKTAVPAGGVVKLKMLGTDGVPADAAAVVLNLTAADSAGGGYVTAYPDGTAAPNSSNLNFSAGQVVANVAIVKLGGDGSIDLKNTSNGTVDLIADLEGYYASDGLGYEPNTPARLVDTRKSKTTIPAGGTLRVQVATGPAVVLNATVTNPTSAGYLTAYRDGTAAPTASNVNFVAKQTVANEVMVEEGSDGYVDFKNSSPGSIDLIVDKYGTFSSGIGSAFVPLAPTRVLDTRKGIGTLYIGNSGATPPLAMPAFSTGTDPLNEAGSPVPVQADAVAANLTVVGPTSAGYLTAWDAYSIFQPTGSTVDFTAGQVVANAATIPLGDVSPSGGMLIYNGSPGSTPIVMGVFGYYED
jgi:hypothetical protein